MYESITMLFAGFTQVVTGFGFALLAVPVLSFFIATPTIVMLVVFFSLLINAAIVIQTRTQLKLKEMKYLLLFSLIGIPIGVLFLRVANPDILKLLIGILALATAILMMRGARLHIKNGGVAEGIAGFLSGFLNGSISMSGPPVVLFLANRGDGKEAFRGNLSVFAVFINAITLVSLIASGSLTGDVFRDAAQSAPGVIVGSLLGIVLIKRINEKLFRRIVLLLIVAAGAAAIITSLGRLVKG